MAPNVPTACVQVAVAKGNEDANATPTGGLVGDNALAVATIGADVCVKDAGSHVAHRVRC